MAGVVIMVGVVYIPVGVVYMAGLVIMVGDTVLGAAIMAVTTEDITIGDMRPILFHQHKDIRC